MTRQQQQPRPQQQPRGAPPAQTRPPVPAASSAGGKSGMNSEQLALLRGTVAKGLTDDDIDQHPVRDRGFARGHVVSDAGPSSLQRGVGQMTPCKSCGVRIAFARSASTGKLMPFELEATAGEWVLENGTAVHVGKAPATPVEGVETVQRWTSHFARCPDARRWRRR